MRSDQWTTRVGKGMVAVLVLAFAVALMALIVGAGSSQAAAQGPAKMEATIFAYDGKDFVRSKTTMLTADGKSAVDTKLDHDTPAYKALSQKHSYVGDAKVFGRDYDADYAPLISDDGRLIGALFVGVPK